MNTDSAQTSAQGGTPRLRDSKRPRKKLSARWTVAWLVGLATVLSACALPASSDQLEEGTPQPGRAHAPGLVREFERVATPAPTPTPRIVDGVVILPCGDPLVPVDRGHRLERSCVPANLVVLAANYSFGGTQLLTADAAAALISLIDAARAAGLTLWASSSYRSYEEQVTLFAYWVNQLGIEEALRVSARPGHSEHQLGTTTDVVSRSSNYSLNAFPGTAEAAWVAANSWKFGFIVSYPPGKEHITGYAHEPWHIRYVGHSVSAAVHGSGQTLVEYLRMIR